MAEPDEGEIVVETVDIHTAIQADIDRMNVDHRQAAEAMATYFNVLHSQRMSEQLIGVLCCNYQTWLLTGETDDDE